MKLIEDAIPEEVRAFHEALSKNYVEVVEEDVIPEEEVEEPDVIPEEKDDLVAQTTDLISSENLDHQYIVPEEKKLEVFPEEKSTDKELSLKLKGLASWLEEKEQKPVVLPEEISITLADETANLLSSGILDYLDKPIDYLDKPRVYENEEVGELAERIEKVQKSLVHLRQYSPGSGEVRLEYLDDIDRDSVKSDGMYLKYQESTKKWIGSVSTSTGWDPSGYEYTGDASLALIVNDAGAVNGLEIEENTWTVMPCVRGNADNQLPSTFTSRIWDDSTNRFSFAEIPIDGVVLFRVNVDVYPETNNALLTGRIRFVAVNDGTEHVLNEDGDRIVLEDDSGNITGDFFQSYSFFQTVAAQEMANGAGALHERTFIFPVYVGNTNAQRGFGQFELNCSCDFTLNDSSVVGVLN